MPLSFCCEQAIAFVDPPPPPPCVFSRLLFLIPALIGRGSGRVQAVSPGTREETVINCAPYSDVWDSRPHGAHREISLCTIMCPMPHLRTSLSRWQDSESVVSSNSFVEKQCRAGLSPPGRYFSLFSRQDLRLSRRVCRVSRECALVHANYCVCIYVYENLFIRIF